MLFKSNNSFSDELAPLGKELVMLKTGNTYEIVTPDTLEILSNGSYIKLDPETNLDYQRRYYNFTPIYPNYSMRNVPGVDKSYIVIQSYVRRLGKSQYQLFPFQEKVDISEDINYAISIKAITRKFIEATYLADYDSLQRITDPNQEHEEKRTKAIYH
jgi:hypothetical protein